MICRRVREYLDEYIMKDLSAALAAQIAQHLKGCPECQQIYEEQCRLIESLKAYYRRRELVGGYDRCEA